MPQSNMIVQLDEDDSESTDDEIVFTAGGNTYQTGIFATKVCIAGKEIENLIVYT